ncbi:FKBP-type peptidyl-prolyl cis-trans isomerase [Actinomadura atramentaria]|uniref:FKBP-type peptidyl-prolyl cis-trans isomerase n=1 Tax=Actinomadura atramentaria TaxID=1990 RepID=UPI001F0AA2AE|nr:FKBP-type peptidyl-prolyl cis-trans isomerase [Actinomadura atramentaria]
MSRSVPFAAGGRRVRWAAGPAAVVLGVALLAGGCFGGDGVQVEVKGKPGTKPTVTFPKKTDPDGGYAAKTLSDGKGRKVAAGDLVVADYVSYRWNGTQTRLLANTYQSGVPMAFQTGKLVKGLEKALVGARPGSRVVARVPPEDAYGSAGDPAHGVSAGDTLVYVLDVRASFGKDAVVPGRQQTLDDPSLPKVGQVSPGRQASVLMPRTAPPKALKVQALVDGSGPAVAAGQLVAMQYQLMNWRDGRVLSSSWADGEVHTAVAGREELVAGLDRALVGRKTGSRLLVVVPPSLGKAPWRSRFRLAASDTLVFVVDVLGAY